MPRIFPNYANEFKRVEEGEHLCKILNSKVGQGQTGNHYVQWELETVEGKQKIQYITMTEGRGAGMFRHMVHAAGIEDYQDTDIDSESLHGRFVLAMVEMEDYVSPKDGQKKQRPKVKSVEKPTEQQIQKAKAEAEDIPF